MDGIPAGELVDTGSNNGNCNSPVNPTTTTTTTTAVTPIPTSTVSTTTSTQSSSSTSSCISIMNDNAWNVGQNGKLQISFPEAVTSWEIIIKFDKAVDSLAFHQGEVTKLDATTFLVKNRDYNGVQAAGTSISLGWQSLFPDTSSPPQMISTEFKNINCGSSGITSTVTSSVTSSTTNTVSSTTDASTATTTASTTTATTSPTTTATTSPTTTTTTTAPTTTATTTSPTTTATTTSPTTTATTTAPTTTATTSQATSTTSGGSTISSCISVTSGYAWQTGQNGKIELNFPEAVTSWEIIIKFDKAVDSLAFDQGEVTKLDATKFQIKNRDYNGVQSVGGLVSSGWQSLFPDTSSPPQMISTEFKNINCGSSALTTTASPNTSSSVTTDTPTTTVTTDLPTTTITTATTTKTTDTSTTTATTAAPITDTTTVDGNSQSTKYDYNEVLKLSNLFYQAQRSGALDTFGDFDHAKIAYRKDSALQDGSDNGVDLTGGYYDGKILIFSWSKVFQKYDVNTKLVAYKQAENQNVGQYLLISLFSYILER